MGAFQMKKTILKVTVAALTLLLAGCGSGTKQKDVAKNSSTSVKTEQTSSHKAKKHASSSTSSKKTSSSVKDSSQTGSNGSTGSNNNGNQGGGHSEAPTNNEPRLVTINSALNRTLGHVLLPQADGLGQGSANLNARTTGDSANYTVYYSVGNRPLPVNDPAVQNEIPYATVSKKTYGSVAAAKASINYRSGAGEEGLPKVDLGHNISGTIDSGAGNRYLHWNEGQWSLVVHAAAVNGEEPTAKAKQVVELLEKYYLPAPKTVASGEFEVSGGNKLTWQDQTTVYSVTGPSLETIIIMAASMK